MDNISFDVHRNHVFPTKFQQCALSGLKTPHSYVQLIKIPAACGAPIYRILLNSLETFQNRAVRFFFSSEYSRDTGVIPLSLCADIQSFESRPNLYRLCQLHNTYQSCKTSRLFTFLAIVHLSLFS